MLLRRFMHTVVLCLMEGQPPSGSQIVDMVLIRDIRCSYVGTGGHSGHGGYGHHSRMWGLILDVIYEVTVVLPDGSIVTASESENSDLFWVRISCSSHIYIAHLTFRVIRLFVDPLAHSVSFTSSRRRHSKRPLKHPSSTISGTLSLSRLQLQPSHRSSLL